MISRVLSLENPGAPGSLHRSGPGVRGGSELDELDELGEVADELDEEEDDDEPIPDGPQRCTQCTHELAAIVLQVMPLNGPGSAWLHRRFGGERQQFLCVACAERRFGR